MDLTIKYFCASFFLAYIIVAFVWPTLRTWKRTGVKPITFGNSDSAHDYIGRVFTGLLGLIAAVIIIYWHGDFYDFLLPARYIEIFHIQMLGIAICAISFLWTVIAQSQMGDAWTIGIDEAKSTELVVKGLFGVSRNPIFLGMILTLIGFFFLMPNAITLLVMVTGYFMIQLQFRLEEDFLLKQHGDLYVDYKLRTRRLL